MFCHFLSKIFRLRTILECKICLSCEQMLVYNQCTGTPSLAEYILTIQLNSVERAGRVRRDDQLSTNQYKHSNEGCFSKLVILEYWAINVKNKKRFWLVVLNLIFEQIVTEMLSLETTQSDIFDETPFTFKYVTQQRGWNHRDAKWRAKSVRTFRPPLLRSDI